MMITVSTICLFNKTGNLLLVRKRGTRYFMLPGGKPESNETAEQALLREIREELDLKLDPTTLHFWGQWIADAANEPSAKIRASIWWATIDQPVIAAAEIEELIWLNPLVPTDLLLAPLLDKQIIPMLQTATLERDNPSRIFIQQQ